MEPETIEWLIGLPLLGGLLLASWLAIEHGQQRLADPHDDRTLFLDQLPSKAALRPWGTYRVTVFRQSGNIHSEQIVIGSKNDAMAVAIATFRRARIDGVNVLENTEERLTFGRMSHDHRGVAEGKKVGSARVDLVEQQTGGELLESAIRLSPIGYKCDCGERREFQYEELLEAKTCTSCSKEISFTKDQLAQIDRAIAQTREELLARYRAGEPITRVAHKGTLRDS